MIAVFEPPTTGEKAFLALIGIAVVFGMGTAVFVLAKFLRWLLRVK